MVTRQHPPRRLDLRTGTFPDVIDHAERGLGVALNLDTTVVKRRSLGARTDRASWVRIEARPFDRLHGQSADGVEASALVAGVAKPAWYRGLSWIDHDRGIIWRADETELVSAVPVSSGGILTVEPDLPDSWWRTLATSLDALVAALSGRVATVHTMPCTQERLSETIRSVFGPDVDATVMAWGAVHADFAWTNLTAPELIILDWEDFGRGPAGLDHASLWCASLAVPALVERIEREFAPVFATRSGKLCQLFYLAELLVAPADYAGALREPAENAAESVLSSLR